MTLSDDDRRILAAVAMGFVWCLPYGIRGRRWIKYSIAGHDVTNQVRRLMAKQLVAYVNGTLQTVNRR